MSATRCWWVIGLLWACNHASEINLAELSAARTDAGAARAPVASPVPAAPLPAAPAPRGQPQPKLAVGSAIFKVSGRPPLKLDVEVAATDREREIGLMFRERMGDDEGMLFLFRTEKHNSFWMHNTLIPLDMFFIDSEWTVVGVVENAKPLTDDPRYVGKMSQYVLEVNAGFAAKHGLGAGAKLEFTPPAGLVMP